MPVLVQKTQLAAKLETVEGTPESPGAADALLVMEPSFEPQVEMYARKVVGGDLSAYKSLSGRCSARVSFEVELKGSGSPGVAPVFGRLLQACGFSESVVAGTSVTYTPASTGIPSLTLALYLDGLRVLVWGARGNVRFSFSAGEPGRMAFEFVGAGFSVADEALLTGVAYGGVTPEVFLAAGLALDGYAARIERLDVDMGNSLQLRSDVNQASGYRSAVITGRRPVGTLDPELTLVADYDWFGKWQSGSEGSLSFSLGETAGNVVSVSAPRCRYSRLGLAERGQVRTLGADFELNRDAGDDELSIVLT